jgi:predicted nucleic acid-binding protein
VVVLDTTLLVDLQRGSAKALAALRQLNPPLHVPAVVWTEFLVGLPPLERQRAAAKLEASVVFEAYGREIAEGAARLGYEMAQEGNVLGIADLQVAATALHLGEPLVSNDASFRRVPGLDVKPH